MFNEDIFSRVDIPLQQESEVGLAISDNARLADHVHNQVKLISRS